MLKFHKPWQALGSTIVDGSDLLETQNRYTNTVRDGTNRERQCRRVHWTVPECACVKRLRMHTTGLVKMYRLSVRIREKISSHRLHQTRMRCECWIAGEHNMVCSYVIRTEPGWTSLRVFKCKAGYLSSVSAILLLSGYDIINAVP